MNTPGKTAAELRAMAEAYAKAKRACLDSADALQAAVWCDEQIAELRAAAEREGEARVPDGFAVVMENNAFVGLYHWRTAAEQLATKSPGWRVRPMIFAD